MGASVSVLCFVFGCLRKLGSVATLYVIAKGGGTLAQPYMLAVLSIKTLWEHCGNICILI